MSVKLYVEGGGNHNKALQSRCREGFSKFISRSGMGGRMPRIVACGGRQQAFDDFRTAHAQHGQTSLPVLLVDSESPMLAESPWEHVRDRPGDGWQRPGGATDDQLHFMVQAMEAWLYADPEELQAFYRQHFRSGALSGQTDIEIIPKAVLLTRLRAATVDCPKGQYSKGEHSFEILGRIDPLKVRAASPQCERFLSALDRMCR